MTFSPDGKNLASGLQDGNIRLWTVSSGEKIHSFTGHTNSVVSLSFNQNGELLISGSTDHTLRVWNVVKGIELRSFSGHTNSVLNTMFSQNEQTIVSGSSDGILHQWNCQPYNLFFQDRKPTALYKKFMKGVLFFWENDQNLKSTKPANYRIKQINCKDLNTLKHPPELEQNKFEQILYWAKKNL